MDRRVDVTEVPFVRRDLTIRLHVPLAREQVELLLRKRRVDQGQRDAMECRIPGREEGVFPPIAMTSGSNSAIHGDEYALVRHRKNISDVQMLPILSTHPGQSLTEYGHEWNHVPCF